VAQADDAVSDEAHAYQVLFSIPQIDSAFMRNPAGGGRLKIDIDQATVAAVNAMLDEAVRRSGVTFAAAIVIVGQKAEPPTPKVRGWKEPKLKK
jgi:hypothetical protein